MNQNKWQNSTIIIVVHEATTGPSHDLRDYFLKQNVSRLLFIAHPLLYLKENFKKSSRIERYENGKLVQKSSAYHWIFPEPILYLKDVLYTSYWCLRYGKGADLYIGVGNLNAFAGLIIRSFSGVKRVVYYVIDYVPNRFPNVTINKVYHWIEKICADKADVSWNLSPRMIEAREKKWNQTFSKQIIVPHGVHYERIKRVPFNIINKHEILYMGSLLEKQGIQLVIKTLPKLIKKIPNIQLTIIGKGPYEEALRELVNKLHVEKYVQFLGYIDSHHEMEDRMAKAAIAIALYDKKHDQFSYFADPGKIKNYLGAGVPVIMTDVPYVARLVEKAKCGFIIKYDEDELFALFLNYFSNNDTIKEYRKNATIFAKTYDWDKVFDNALKSIYN